MEALWSLVQLVLLALLVIFVVSIVKASIRPPNYPPGKKLEKSKKVIVC